MEENEKKSKNGKKIIIIILVVLLALGIIIALSLYVVPKVKEEGLNGLFNPTILSKEEESYYNLYLPELEKYLDLNEENYSYEFRLYYFEGINEPVIVLKHENENYETRMGHDKVTLFYIKDGKVVTKEYDYVANVRLIYNTEKDELDYYLIQIKDYSEYTYTLLKDIVTENPSPYVVKLSSNDYFSTTYKNNGAKVSVPKYTVAFIDNLDSYVDNKVYDQRIYKVDGIDQFKGSLKKAVSSKYTLNDLVTSSTKERALEQLGIYNITPGQKILGGSNTSNNTNNNSSNNNSNQTQTTSKCNSGFVYVSDDNRCYSSTDKKNQINRCGASEIDLNGDCGTAVDSSLCSNNDQYEEINGYCIDKYTLHTKSMECEAGYDILFGSYSGQEFNGACYRYMSPNY